MAEKTSRRTVLKSAAIGAAAMAVPAIAQTPPAKPPPLPAEDVKSFVIAGHHDLPKVQEMLSREPRLLNACWDWGGGDFETALEGAGHMGRKDIARFLVSKGSRLNIFQAAMLGELELVKSLIEAHPESARSLGPHGIPLLAHAKAGGDEAKAVFEYLEKLA